MYTRVPEKKIKQYPIHSEYYNLVTIVIGEKYQDIVDTIIVAYKYMTAYCVQKNNNLFVSSG